MPPSARRLPAIDWMRGLVMALMAVDHASDVFNRNVLAADSYGMGALGASLYRVEGNPLHFLTRWVSHLCAPTFVFLAGTALAISVERRLARGESAWSIDRHLAIRGLLIIALEFWVALGFTVLAVQVLYAIGAAMVCMVLLRRLPSRALLVGALAWMVGGEWVTGALGLMPTPPPPWPPPATSWAANLLVINGVQTLPFDIPIDYFGLKRQVLVLYPLIPWLSVMVLGWVFGRWLEHRREQDDLEARAARLLVTWGLMALTVWFLQRWIDGYGNFWLTRTDADPLRWLQVSKYPPSLAFLALELGLMALILAGLLRLQVAGGQVRDRAPLLVFGQTALFFYLIHVHLMGAWRAIFHGGVFGPGAPFGLAGAWLGALGVLVVTYPLCLRYRALKRARPRSFLRFI